MVEHKNRKSIKSVSRMPNKVVMRQRFIAGAALTFLLVGSTIEIRGVTDNSSDAICFASWSGR